MPITHEEWVKEKKKTQTWDDTYIDIPLNLDVSQYCINSRSKSTQYSLYSIINHIGSIDSGHYYSYTKSNVNNKWYECNDTFIIEKPILLAMRNSMFNPSQFLVRTKLCQMEDTRTQIKII